MTLNSSSPLHALCFTLAPRTPACQVLKWPVWVKGIRSTGQTQKRFLHSYFDTARTGSCCREHTRPGITTSPVLRRPRKSRLPPTAARRGRPALAAGADCSAATLQPDRGRSPSAAAQNAIARAFPRWVSHALFGDSVQPAGPGPTTKVRVALATAADGGPSAVRLH